MGKLIARACVCLCVCEALLAITNNDDLRPTEVVVVVRLLPRPGRRLLMMVVVIVVVVVSLSGDNQIGSSPECVCVRLAGSTQNRKLRGNLRSCLRDDLQTNEKQTPATVAPAPPTPTSSERPAYPPVRPLDTRSIAAINRSLTTREQSKSDEPPRHHAQERAAGGR
jgi:hypothetical protein